MRSVNCRGPLRRNSGAGLGALLAAVRASSLLTHSEHGRAFLGPPEGLTARLYGLAEGLCLVLGNLACRIGAPERPGELVELRRGGGARNGGAELVVDHGSRPLLSWGRVGQANPVRKSEAFR